MDEVRCEADFRAQLCEVLAAQPKGRVLGRKLQGEPLREWTAALELTCFSPYGAEVGFPGHFADLTMWVARVSARPSDDGTAPSKKKGAGAKPKARAKAAVEMPPPHLLRTADLEAPRKDTEYRAARKQEQSRRGKLAKTRAAPPTLE